jgi:hypothetical protein
VRGEPGEPGAHTGRFLFVIAAEGHFRPTHDGSVQVTIGFQRPVSLTQIIWRLILFVLVGGVIAITLSGRSVVVFPIAAGAAFVAAVTVVPWSCVAYVQGMCQAGRDWRELLEMIRGALNSHTVEPA